MENLTLWRLDLKHIEATYGFAFSEDWSFLSKKSLQLMEQLISGVTVIHICVETAYCFGIGCEGSLSQSK